MQTRPGKHVSEIRGIQNTPSKRGLYLNLSDYVNLESVCHANMYKDLEKRV